MSLQNTITTSNPATGEVITNIPTSSIQEITEITNRAHNSKSSWSALSYKQRGKFLLKARKYLLEHIDELALTITQENGKPLVESLTAELYPISELLYYYAHKTEKILRKHSLDTGILKLMQRSSQLHYQPYGVVAVISPWNYPFSIAAGTVAMALAAGNCVILKPSEHTPLVGKKIADVFAAAGLPAGVLQVLQGDGSVGAALCRAEVDKIFFTGSTATGSRIMAACADNVIPCNLELGGKDAMIVCADANLEVASSGAVWGAFTNAGQCCASVERCYVHESVADEFIALVKTKTLKLQQGLGTNSNVEIGPLTTEFQLATVERQVADARNRGAAIITGGERNREFTGYFYKPTVLIGVDHTFEVMREETFGPLLPIMTFSNEDEAVNLANDSKYGLLASVWSNDMNRAKKIANRLQVGTVVVNDCLYTHAIPETPWGGRKGSGFGRTHGALGLLEMVQPFHMHVNPVRNRHDVWWYPYDQSLYLVFKKFARELSGSWFQKILNIPLLLKTLRIKKM